MVDLPLMFNEFILPQYVNFLTSTLSHFQLSYLSSQSNYFHGIFSMLPHVLRPVDYQPLGMSFCSLNITNVCLGGSPIAEARISFPGYTYYVFSMVVFFLIFFVLKLGKKYPYLLFFGIPYLCIFGRADVAGFIFFVFYSTLIFKLLVAKIKVN
ncbi:hypothetical protein [Piscirickettsia litoralis]|uniref:Uncharacterized protein n=1 Tax=Piscirickettsia litoralis TaxID=1891921 RepID=A0ABX3A2V3_9GAMM|nr:hypothetical protein [Piscirickettsia litoralis]ODN42969.1 hypothetical protein BGC07_08605 [Piscirickettsia litoralis]